MDFHTEFGMVLLFVYAFQNWDPFTNIHSNIQILTHTRPNLLVGTKIYALHIACVETDLSLMNVFHLSINDWKTWHPTKYDIFPFCSLQSSSCRNWNDLTHIFSLFRVLQMKTSSLLQLQLLYVFQTNNSFNMLSNWIKRFTIIIVDLKIYVHKNYMHTFQLKCRIIYLPQLQILVLVYYFLKWRQDLMR